MCTLFIILFRKCILQFWGVEFFRCPIKFVDSVFQTLISLLIFLYFFFVSVTERGLLKSPYLFLLVALKLVTFTLGSSKSFQAFSYSKWYHIPSHNCHFTLSTYDITRVIILQQYNSIYLSQYSCCYIHAVITIL